MVAQTAVNRSRIVTVMQGLVLIILISLIVFLLALFSPSHAFADDGYMGGVGQIPIPRNSHDIAMEKEVVNVILHEGFAEVECAYRFKNEGKAQTVNMGFPERPSMEGGFIPITIFRAYIDGKEIPVKKTQITLTPGQYGYDQFEATSNWFIQEIPFKEGETKVVVNRYLSPNGGGVSSRKSYRTSFAYILHTGSTWEGKIGKADVNVTFAGGFTKDLFNPDPQAFKDEGMELMPKGTVKPDAPVSDNGVKWTFTEIDPKPHVDDILISFYRSLLPGGSTPLTASADSWLKAGQYNYPPEQAFDGDITTAWAEGVAGSGIGQSITATFKEPTAVEEVRILPGYTKRYDLFKKYSRPKNLTIAFSDGTVKHVKLDDDPRVQYIQLGKPVTVGSAKFTIDDVYKGDGAEDAYITEIEFGTKKTPAVGDAESILTGKRSSSTTTTTTERSAVSSSEADKATTGSKSKDTSKKSLPALAIVAIIIAAFAAGVIVSRVIVIVKARREKG